jgi:hypothetical protein
MLHPHLISPVVRVGSLLAGCAGAAVGAWSLAVPALAPVTGGRGPLALADLLAAGCAVAVLGCVGWLLLVTGLTVVATAGRLAAPGSAATLALGRVSERACPVALRTMLTATLGVSLTMAAAGPSVADPPGPGPAAAALTGLALPDRTTGTAALSTTRAVAPPTRGPAVVTVRPGDSLWAVASGLLGGDPDDAAVTRAWHLLYALNHRRVGDDPDLLHPGTRLVVPGDLAPDREDPP